MQAVATLHVVHTARVLLKGNIMWAPTTERPHVERQGLGFEPRCPYTIYSLLIPMPAPLLQLASGVEKKQHLERTLRQFLIRGSRHVHVYTMYMCITGVLPDSYRLEATLHLLVLYMVALVFVQRTRQRKQWNEERRTRLSPPPRETRDRPPEIGLCVCWTQLSGRTCRLDCTAQLHRINIWSCVV